jgi:hypothetical protein
MDVGLDAGEPPQEDAHAQVQAECKAADDCKSRRQPAAGFEWSCDDGRCMEQAAPEPAKSDGKQEPEKDDKFWKWGKPRAKKK